MSFLWLCAPRLWRGWAILLLLRLFISRWLPLWSYLVGSCHHLLHLSLECAKHVRSMRWITSSEDFCERLR